MIDHPRIYKIPPTSLEDFPSDLIIEIFEALDRSAITAFNLTARKFYLIWHEYAFTISKTVLAREVSCYDSAIELVNIQNSKTPRQHDDEYMTVLARNQNLLENATKVSLACKYHESLIPRDDLWCLWCPPGQIKTFQEVKGYRVSDPLAFRATYYRLSCVTALWSKSNNEAQEAYLATIGYDQLYRMRSTLSWIKAAFTGKQKGYLGIENTLDASNSLYVWPGTIRESSWFLAISLITNELAKRPERGNNVLDGGCEI